MSASASAENKLLETFSQAFMERYPREAARRVELMPVAPAAELLQGLPASRLARLWEYLPPLSAENLALELLPRQLAELLAHLPVGPAATLLAAMEAQRREAVLQVCPAALARELRDTLAYPENSAGRLMDTRLVAFNENTAVGDALQTLRERGAQVIRYLFLLDDELRLIGEVDVHRLALADPRAHLAALKNPVATSVMVMEHRDDVVAAFEEFRRQALPVVDTENRLVGVIHGKGLLDTVQEDLASDLQAMVGVSRDERAKSSSLFAVRKRLPWLVINLGTAFLAASVVGLFEGTIAQFTALAVLLPVAAGQSGNTGAQALAVTMRGLTLREISTRDWWRMLIKEIGAGMLNGLAIAIICALGVYLWSQSYGLALVMALAMVISMTVAGVAGAVVPMLLKRLGVDPASSSSIVLTTITDIAGFLSFLGIATLLSAMLISAPV